MIMADKAARRVRGVGVAPSRTGYALRSLTFNCQCCVEKWRVRVFSAPIAPLPAELRSPTSGETPPLRPWPPGSGGRHLRRPWASERCAGRRRSRSPTLCTLAEGDSISLPPSHCQPDENSSFYALSARSGCASDAAAVVRVALVGRFAPWASEIAGDMLRCVPHARRTHSFPDM